MIYIGQVIIQQSRAIHPDIAMNNPEFLRGYATGLRDGLHPELPEGSPSFTDEDMIQAIRECVAEEPDTLPYILGCYIGSIVARCR